MILAIGEYTSRSTKAVIGLLDEVIKKSDKEV